MIALLRHSTTAAGSVFLAFAAQAVDFRGVIEELQGSPQPAARIQQIDAQARADFDAALQEYDEQIRRHPFDVVDQLRRCRFIDEFASTYESANFIDEIYEQSQQCNESLADRHPEHPEVLLQQLQGTYGENQLEQGVELLRKLPRQSWTSGQLARLYSLLARTADTLGKKNALDYALKALELDEASDVQIIAATRLIDRGDKDRAREILSSPVSTSNPKDAWSLVQKMGLLARLGAHEQVLEVHSKLGDSGGYSHIEAARSLRTAGAIASARKELELAIQQGNYTAEDEKERFRFELELGTAQAALAAYNTWRELGWKHDPIAINRVTLASRDLSLPWRARDLIGLLALVLAIVLIGLAVALPLSFIHYRGLALRAKSGDSYPSDGWQLRHAWAALFAFGFASLLSLYAAGPIDLMAGAATSWGIDVTPAQLARITLAESLLAIVLLLPLGGLASRRQPAWWGTHWSIGKSLLAGASIGLAFRVPLLLASLARPDAAPLLAPDDPIWQLLLQVREQFGIAAAFWVLAIAAPVIEEFVFRGVLLAAFSAHVGFAWANAFQAALFSAMHMNLKAAVLLFVVGAVLGWLTRRSGGLLAPIIMHALFNLIAGMKFL